MLGVTFLNALTNPAKTRIAAAMIETLDDVRRDLAVQFNRAANDRKSPMHVPVVVTSDVDARGMVLRGFDEGKWTLRFHTDVRAPKVAAIQADPRMAVLLYDKSAKIQIRARGLGHILRDDPLTDHAWASSDNFARRCYLGEGPGAPSETATSGLPAAFEGHEPTDEQLIPARPNFAVLLIELTHIDWFYLAHTGHKRAQFTRGGESWDGQWVSP